MITCQEADYHSRASQPEPSPAGPFTPLDSPVPIADHVRPARAAALRLVPRAPARPGPEPGGRPVPPDRPRGALCPRSYRCLAERLASSGYPALRFDYDGTGDSCGSDEDPDRVASWLASIGYAIDALRDRSRTEGVALFGVRLGATLAAVAAAERGDVQDLVLWAACPTGRSFLRELRVLRAAHGQGESAGGKRRRKTGRRPRGSSSRARPPMPSADWTRPRSSRRPAPAALLIGRDDLPDRLAPRPESGRAGGGRDAGGVARLCGDDARPPGNADPRRGPRLDPRLARRPLRRRPRTAPARRARPPARPSPPRDYTEEPLHVGDPPP